MRMTGGGGGGVRGGGGGGWAGWREAQRAADWVKTLKTSVKTVTLGGLGSEVPPWRRHFGAPGVETPPLRLHPRHLYLPPLARSLQHDFYPLLHCPHLLVPLPDGGWQTCNSHTGQALSGV